MLAYIFVLFAVAARLPFMPHPWGFTPVTAALLYFGARGSRRHMWLPLVLLAASDVVLDKFVYAYPLSWDLLLAWGWYAAMLWLGSGLRQNSKILRIAGAALAGSVSFYLITNFGVWAATAMYPKTLAGLVTCYVAGVPFFRDVGARILDLQPGALATWLYEELLRAKAIAVEGDLIVPTMAA